MVPIFGEERLSMTLWKESLNSDGQQFHQYQQNATGIKISVSYTT